MGEGEASLEDILASATAVFAPLSPDDLARREAESARRDAERIARAAREREARWERMVPRRYHWAHRDAPELAERCTPVRSTGARSTPREAIDAMLAHPGMVVLRGPPGSGKTSLAIAALRALWDRGGVSLHYADAHALGTVRVQHAAGRGEAPLVEAAIAAELLLLDDLGQERQTQTNAVPDVILSRHAADVPTWITTGEDFPQLAAKYGGGVARRLREGALVIQCAARSAR